jgi:hypothetical protein
MVEPNSPWSRTHGNTASPVPAFLGVEDNRGLSLFRIGNQEVNLAYLYTDIAPITYIRVKYHRIGRSAPVGEGIYFFLHHATPLRNRL